MNTENLRKVFDKMIADNIAFAEKRGEDINNKMSGSDWVFEFACFMVEAHPEEEKSLGELMPDFEC